MEFAGYVVEGKIGEGAAGVVWAATQTGVDRRVAIRQLATDLAADESFRERFRGEARVLATVHHANVIAVYDYVDDGNAPYLVEEFVDGASLDRVVARGSAPRRTGGRRSPRRVERSRGRARARSGSRRPAAGKHSGESRRCVEARGCRARVGAEGDTACERLLEPRGGQRRRARRPQRRVFSRLRALRVADGRAALRRLLDTVARRATPQRTGAGALR